MNLIDSIILAVIMALLIMFGYVLNPIVTNYHEEKNTMSISDYSSCSNLSYDNTTICLVSYVKSFYNYTIRDDIDRTLEDIKNNGGDCYDYSKLYEKMANSLGLNSTTYAFYGETGHRFAIIYDYKMTGYCQIDLLNYVCRSFG
jgi:hypothetical protein